MPDQFRGPVCTAPVVVFQRRIEMAGVKCIGEIGEKYVRPSLFGCPMPPAKFVKKVLKLRRKPLPQLSQGPLQAAVRALKQDRKSTRLNSSHYCATRMQSSACKKKNTTQQSK